MATVTKVEGNTITLETMSWKAGDRLEVVPPDCYVITPKELFSVFCVGCFVGLLATLLLVS